MGFFVLEDGEGVSTSPLIWFSPQGSDESLAHAMAQVIERGAKSLMILSCSGNNHSREQLQHPLRTCPVPLCGGIFPSIFFDETKFDVGFIVIGFPFVVSIACYQINDQQQVDVDSPIRLDGDLVRHSRDLMVFVDAMADGAESFINALYETIGGGINVIGGGAGAIDFQPIPCVFSRQGLLEGVGQVVQLPIPMRSSVEHGWKVMSGPYLVTEANGRRIETLNYQPAYEIYKSVIEEACSQKIDVATFFNTSKNFPLGIVGVSGEILVRDPIQLCENALLCVGSVPVNTMVYILSGDRDCIINAAQSAGEQLKQELLESTDNPLQFALVFDCVSRALYLDDQFAGEMQAIKKGLGKGVRIIGVLSIGEIANTRRGTISLLNKSIVIGSL